MFTLLFWSLPAVAGFDWLASWRGWRRVRWLSKPGALLLLIAWFLQAGGWQGDLRWFALGLMFSLLGDVLLMLPARYFLAGAGAFALAHIAYIIGFWQQPLDPRWQAALPLLLVGLVFWRLNRRIQGGLRRSGDTALCLPVMVYAAVLSLMWLSALSTLLRPAWGLVPALLASAGGGLFLFSDALLADNRFVRPLPRADLLVMVSYHLGQALIAAGVLIQYGGLAG